MELQCIKRYISTTWKSNIAHTESSSVHDRQYRRLRLQIVNEQFMNTAFIALVHINWFPVQFNSMTRCLIHAKQSAIRRFFSRPRPIFHPVVSLSLFFGKCELPKKSTIMTLWHKFFPSTPENQHRFEWFVASTLAYGFIAIVTLLFAHTRNQPSARCQPRKCYIISIMLIFPLY